MHLMSKMGEYQTKESPSKDNMRTLHHNKS